MSRAGCTVGNANCCPAEVCSYFRQSVGRQCELCIERASFEQRMVYEAIIGDRSSIEDSNPGIKDEGGGNPSP
jgi:hypothetical protein